MKRILSIILVFTVVFYLIETSVLTGFSQYKPSLEINRETDEYTLSWPRVPYPAYYQVETIPNQSKTEYPDNLIGKAIKYRTWKNNFAIDPNIPTNTLVRVSAQGLFSHPLGTYSDFISIAKLTKTTPQDVAALKPVSTTNYGDATITELPFFSWTPIPGAIRYELEVLSAPPENPNDVSPSRYQLWITKRIYTNACLADFSAVPANEFYWRVRALDYDEEPLGVFSDAIKVNIDHNLEYTLKPQTKSQEAIPEEQFILYPVYSFIPLPNVNKYEIELLSQPPETENDTSPSEYRVWSKTVENIIDIYDDEQRTAQETYYWRVRGIADDGSPIGVWSDTAVYTCNAAVSVYAATFGDSITHGGGGISYSPADLEFSYQTYLRFPVLNLGRSGDTAQTMNERFEQDVLPFKPRFLLILGGTNSLRGGVSAQEVINDLNEIRNKCIANDIRPIFLTLPPINPDAIYRAFQEETVENWREEFDKVNEWIKRQPYYIDIAPYLCDGNRELPMIYGLDGLHPDIQGKKLMAQVINHKWLKVTR